MPSIKNLKKDINHTLGDLIGECNIWELENPQAEGSKTEAIVEEVIDVYDSLLAKVHTKNIENKKAHFKAISQELETKSNEIVGKINNL